MMRLAVTADLHLPISSDAAIIEIAQEMADFEPGAVVVAGDVAENLRAFRRCLSLVRETVACPVWVLPGNHDVWVRPGADSRTLWEGHLRDLTEQSDCHWLEGTGFRLGDVGVAGTVAWYDYSSADPSIKADAIEFARRKMDFINNALLIDWPWSDPEFARLCGTPFLAALDRFEADPKVRHVVAVTHMPLLEAQMPRKPDNPEWGFSNAYFGNLTLGAAVLARRKVTHVVSGHTHVGRDAVIPRDGGSPVRAVVIDSRYGHPTWLRLTLPDPKRDEARHP